MKTFYGLKKVKGLNKAVVALGVFDGVHLGHRRILKALVRKAKETKGQSVVITFWPHPQGKSSLYSLEHRLRLIEELGVENCIIVPFNAKFSEISAADFISDILVGKLNARYIYIGENFRFGRQASGDSRVLKAFSRVHGFTVKVFKVVRAGKNPVSSTLIRGLISSGRIKQAEKLLGRRVSVLGTVIKGTALGRILGFPTANIDPHHEVIPAAGIYAVEVVFESRSFSGLCYIGTRPTIKTKTKKINIEVHILDFCRNIYGKFLELRFVSLIRPDRKFPSLGALAEQVARDIALARKILP
jgi:riboflavin kinase/FMN adenylyltransferase